MFRLVLLFTIVHITVHIDLLSGLRPKRSEMTSTIDYCQRRFNRSLCFCWH